MAWSDGLKSMFESFKSGFQNNNNNSTLDSSASNSPAPTHPATVNPDDFIDSSWSGAWTKF